MKPIPITIKTHTTGLIAGLAFGVALVTLLAVGSSAFAGTPSWSPDASERLIKLPSTYLKKAIDRDFEGSELAVAIGDVNSQIKLKSQTLKDLQKAVEQAEGEIKIEMRHQFLAEKREFIKLMGERMDLSQKQIETKVKLYERLLDKLSSRNAYMSPTKTALLKKQETARQRFENSVTAIDMKLFGSTTVKESKYSKDFAKNMGAIEQLVTALKSHPMNVAEMGEDGQPLNKEDYLRQQIMNGQANIALFEQENTILGYMAKLVALDAMTLAEEVGSSDLADATGGGSVNVSDTVDFFVSP